MKTISSRQNPLIKDLHLLATSATERRQQAKTLLDGVHLVQAAIAHGVSLDTPAGILAVIKLPTEMTVKPVTSSCVVLEAVQDAGNLGTILRTAAAAGIETVFLSEGCAQAWSPRVLRAAMGAHFLLSVYEKVNIAELLADYQGVSVATSLDGARNLYEMNLRQPIAWLFGSEGQGLSDSTMALAQQKIMIPMAKGVESLNVAAAAAVCLFEERRQKLV